MTCRAVQMLKKKLAPFGNGLDDKASGIVCILDKQMRPVACHL